MKKQDWHHYSDHPLKVPQEWEWWCHSCLLLGSISLSEVLDSEVCSKKISYRIFLTKYYSTTIPVLRHEKWAHRRCCILHKIPRKGNRRKSSRSRKTGRYNRARVSQVSEGSGREQAWLAATLGGAVMWLRGHAAQQSLQLLLPETLPLVQVLLPDEQWGLALHYLPVLFLLLATQVLGQNGSHHGLPSLQVLSQALGIIPLSTQQTVAVLQGFLNDGERTEREKILSPGIICPSTRAGRPLQTRLWLLLQGHEQKIIQ